MSEKSYKVGIIINKPNANSYRRAIAVCSCGQHMILNNYYATKITCEKCANDYFADIKHRHLSGRFVIPYLESERRDNRGFKVKRTNLSVNYSDGFLTPIKENLKRTIEYDIVDKVLKVWRNDVIEYDYSEHGMNSHYLDYTNTRFFTMLSENDFIQFISNEVTEDMYQTVKLLGDRGYNKSNNIIQGFARLMQQENSWMQILANAGVPQVSRFYKNRYGYYRNNNATDSIIDITKTKPHEILKVPKFMMQYIREDLTIDRNVLSELQGQFKSLDNNKFREIMSIVKDESNIKELSNCIERLMQIHIDYDYTNIKKLVLYVFRECRLTQGIESPSNASTYLRDYIRMSRALNLEYEKYPKSLKKEHDVVQMNYKLINDSSDKQTAFKLAVGAKSYQRFVFEDKKADFTIIAPTEYQDLVKEGNQLSHCVSSYVKDVSNEKCKIYFLRNKEQIETPLATIEVRGLNIRQARGFANRPVGEEERTFISKWAEEKGLIEAYY